jgi:hypothetical protein
VAIVRTLNAWRRRQAPALLCAAIVGWALALPTVIG